MEQERGDERDCSDAQIRKYRREEALSVGRVMLAASARQWGNRVGECRIHIAG
nr:hypothetical protein [Candidatus Njordarchaeota archaeon]